MTLEKLDYDLTVCKVAFIENINMYSEFFFIGKTDEEISLVCKTMDAPQHVTDREDGWKAFRVKGNLDFSLIGIMAKISGVLAANKIPVFAVSTFNTDYVLVKEELFDEAIKALESVGYEIE